MSNSSTKSNGVIWIVIAIVVILFIVYFRSINKEEDANREEEELKKMHEAQKAEQLLVLKSIKERKEEIIVQRDLITQLIEDKKHIKKKADRNFHIAFFIVRLFLVGVSILAFFAYLYLTTEEKQWDYRIIFSKTTEFSGFLILLFGLVFFLFRGSLMSRHKTLEKAKTILKKINYGKYLLIEKDIKMHQDIHAALIAELKFLDQEEAAIMGKLN